MAKTDPATLLPDLSRYSRGHGKNFKPMQQYCIISGLATAFKKKRTEDNIVSSHRGLAKRDFVRIIGRERFGTD
jgi:hypothetical protein